MEAFDNKENLEKIQIKPDLAENCRSHIMCISYYIQWCFCIRKNIFESVLFLYNSRPIFSSKCFKFNVDKTQ